MSEQQEHLTNLLKQRQDLIGEIDGFQAQAAAKRELLLRASGAIEYLQTIGVKLPEPEEAPVEGEAPAKKIVDDRLKYNIKYTTKIIIYNIIIINTRVIRNKKLRKANKSNWIVKWCNEYCDELR